MGMCVCGGVWVYNSHAWYPEEGVGSSGTLVTNNYELLCV